MQANGTGLEGLRVVDLSRDGCGTFAAHRLRTLGADVVTTRVDDDDLARAFGRHLRPVAPDDPTLPDLVARADVLLDDDSAAAVALADVLPATGVRTVITPFGRQGPHAGFTATDLTAEAFGGALTACGVIGRSPIGLGGRLVTTYVGGVAAAVAVAEAWRAERTGDGAVVDVSWVEALAASMDRRAVQILTHSYTGWDAVRADDVPPTLITGIFPCADGAVYVSLYGWHIRTVCELIGDPALDPFHERPSRALTRPHSDEFRARVLAWLRARPWREAVDLGQARGWPVIPANSLRSALHDPWLTEAGLVTVAEGRRLPAHGLRTTPSTPQSEADTDTDAAGVPVVSGGRGRPLEGVRVIDLTVVLSGTATTMALGDLGAEVVRVESRRHYPSATKGPRRLRAEGLETLGNTRRGYADRDPGPDPWNRFAVANVNAREKRSVTLEIETEAGRRAFAELVRRSDVLAENNAPGFLERRGLSPQTLHEINPRLIVLRMPGGSSAGSLAALRGMGPAFEAMAGLRDLRGYPDLPPDRQPESLYMDASTGPAAVAAVVAALRHRQQTGAGSCIELSQLGVMMDHAADQYLRAQEVDEPLPPRENLSPAMAPHGVFRCAGDDEWLAVAARDDGEWAALHRLLTAAAGPGPLPASATLAERQAAWAELDAWLGAWTGSRDKYEAFLALQRAGVTAAPALRESELVADPHMAATGFFLDLDHPVVGVRRTPGPPWRSTAWTLEARRAAPLLGEDNEYVLREVLGYDEETYRALVATGEIGTDYL